MKTVPVENRPRANRLTCLPREPNDASSSLTASRASGTSAEKCPGCNPGRIGKQVKILCGSAAVTGDESSTKATARERGKAEPVGRPRSQKTCFFALIKSRACGPGNCLAKDRMGVELPRPAPTCLRLLHLREPRAFLCPVPALKQRGTGRPHRPESRSSCRFDSPSAGRS